MTSSAIIYTMFYISPGRKDGDADICVLLDRRPDPNKPEPKCLHVKDIGVDDTNIIISPRNIIHKIFENVGFIKDGDRFEKDYRKDSDKRLVFIEFHTKTNVVSPRDFSTLDIMTDNE